MSGPRILASMAAALTALGIALAHVVDPAFGADSTSVTALQREIDETREVAAEVEKAIPRVQRRNEELRATLSTAARDLSAADITASMLRGGSLDVDTVRSHVRTIANRIERREAALVPLDRQIEREAARIRESEASAPETLAAEPEQEKRAELRAVGAALIESLRRLGEAEAEHMALAEERLALLQSRVEMRAIRDQGEFDRDPQVIALRAIVSRLTRDGTRLANDAAAIEPASTADRVHKRLLELQADDAIARATLRLIDLDLLRIRSQIDFLDDLAGDRSIPVRVLRDGRRELGELRSRLAARLAELDEERHALESRRELIRGQGAEAQELIDSQLESVLGLEELLDFQATDIGRLQERSAEATERLDLEVRSRELEVLGQRRRLPTDPRHRELLTSELALMPTTTVDHWRGLAEGLAARLATAPGALLGLLAGAVALLVVVTWWLHRTGLRWLVALDPGGRSSIPLEALRRSLPSLLPVLVWLVVAWALGLEPRPTRLVAGVLLVWPLAHLVLRASDLLAGTTPARASGTGAWGRTALIVAAVVGTAVLAVRVAPMLPSLADMVDRVGFLGVALAAIGAWSLRRTFVGALHDWPEVPPAWLRVLEVATLAVPGLLALAAVVGSIGWIDLGWAIAGGLGAVMAATGLVLVLAGVSRSVANFMEVRVGAQRVAAIDAVHHLVVVVLTVGAAWLLVGAYAESAALMASFWVLAIALALPFVLQPVEALVASFLRIAPESQPAGSISLLAICVDRGVRALLIVGAALGLAWLLDFDLATLAAGDTLRAQVVRAAFNIALVALLADFVWQLAKTVIDQRLALEGEAEGPAEVGGEGGGQGASRLRTLLPLLRKFLMITLAVMVVMLALSSLGVDIGPLLAGAGVVGLAIGFGAQTLVRDIVSGVFFLMDDAFRLGEYIDVGVAKGTVEHISIRSMRLRHHRGALHTVPFGEITHLSNYSRDWVIMKLQFRVPYDTDMQKVKKIFKKIGAEMMADPALGPNLLDPPKSQGVYQMDDSAMIVRAKFMAKPGEQFIIRRELYHRMQKAFEAAGIEFARRQVSVFVPPDGDAEAAAAAAAAAEDEAAAGKKGVQAAE